MNFLCVHVWIVRPEKVYGVTKNLKKYIHLQETKGTLAFCQFIVVNFCFVRNSQAVVMVLFLAVGTGKIFFRYLKRSPAKTVLKRFWNWIWLNFISYFFGLQLFHLFLLHGKIPLIYSFLNFCYNFIRILKIRVLILIRVGVIHRVKRMRHHRRVTMHVHGVVLTENHFERVENFQVKVLNLVYVFGFTKEGQNFFIFLKAIFPFHKLLPDFQKNLFQESKCFFAQNLKLCKGQVLAKLISTLNLELLFGDNDFCDFFLDKK